MKSLISLTLFFILASTLAGFVAAQTPGNAGSDATNKQSVLPVVKSEAAHPVHLARVVSGDDAYKQNCTRCHAEVSKVKDRMTNTIVRHMRVRANLTQDEAKAILEYLTQ